MSFQDDGKVRTPGGQALQCSGSWPSPSAPLPLALHLYPYSIFISKLVKLPLGSVSHSNKLMGPTRGAGAGGVLGTFNS